jgi:hypothetical protein
MYLGEVLADLLPKTDLLNTLPSLSINIVSSNNSTLGAAMPTQLLAASILYTTTFLLGVIMWSFGLVWLCFAISSIYLSRPLLPFNMGWWGFTFPLGVYTLCTIRIGEELPSAVFRMLGTVSISVSRSRVYYTNHHDPDLRRCCNSALVYLRWLYCSGSMEWKAVLCALSG